MPPVMSTAPARSAASWRGPDACSLPACGLLLLVASCGSPAAPSPTDPVRALPIQVTTAHYIFHYSEGDAVQPDTQEQYHDWAVRELGVSIDRPIAYYKYRDRAQIQRVTGMNANAWADPPGFAIHSISSWDNHEVIHVMSALVGRPTDFFNEGLAVSMQVYPQRGQWEPQWENQSVHALAHAFRQNGELPALADIVETGAFRQPADTKSYPMAGSFVKFMTDDRGMDSMKSFFRDGSREASRADVERQFSAAFGVTL